MRETAEKLVHDYYAAFNGGDREAFLALLAPDVIHDISQGARERGVPAFRRFLAHMDECYSEQIADIVVMSDETGTHAAAEFTVHGRYIATDTGLPPAAGQTYTLPAGAFFIIDAGRIARISNHYNLGNWLRQVQAA